MKSSHHEVVLLNLADTEDLRKVSFPDADWYGITCTSATYPAAREIIHLLKKRGKTAIGGVHPTVKSQEVHEDSGADIVFAGECDFAFDDVVSGFIKPGGIMYAGIVEDLNTLPIPDRTLYHISDVVDYTGIHGQERGVPATTVMTSRGCPYACYFCVKAHPMFRIYRMRSEDFVYLELQKLIDDYGIRHVRFVDDEFTLNRARTLRLMKKIRDLALTFVCITRADSLDASLLIEMRKSGCAEIHVGVETASDRLLRLMNKQTTAWDLSVGIGKIKAAGIGVKVYLMYAYPGETDTDRRKTLSWLEMVKPDKFTLSRFTPLPGSELEGDSDYWFYPDEEDEGYMDYKNKIEEAIS